MQVGQFAFSWKVREHVGNTEFSTLDFAGGWRAEERAAGFIFDSGTAHGDEGDSCTASWQIGVALLTDGGN